MVSAEGPVAGELVIDRPAFRVRADPAGARFWVDLGSFTQELRADIGVDSLAAFDQTAEVTWQGSELSLIHI